MKFTLLFIGLLVLAACQNHTDKNTLKSADGEILWNSKYSEKELVSFLDSIGNLDPHVLGEKINLIDNEVRERQTKLNSSLSPADFKQLKSAVKSGEIDLDLATRIFPKIEIGNELRRELKNNKFPIGFYSFDDNEADFNEYAISIGPDNGYFWSNDVYFFKSDKVISKHVINHKYGLELKHFKNENSETVIYYTTNLESGSGVWWHQFDFYCYDKDSLLPALTEIKNINFRALGIRSYSIQSTIVNTKPLTLKFVFKTDLPMMEDYLINDSEEIKYSFDTSKKIYIPQFNNTKLTRLKLISYHLGASDLLFANLHYEQLKEFLNSHDQRKRNAILYFLSELKSIEDQKK